jgi:hypothetical protein
MLIVLLACALLVSLTTLVHYEVLRLLNAGLPLLHMPGRSKLLLVIIAAFLAHALEIAVYGIALFLLVKGLGVGNLLAPASLSVNVFLYFSAETYTSLGFGDLTPVGPVRLLAGAEALNGLLLIGWSVSFAYISMMRFWTNHDVD